MLNSYWQLRRETAAESVIKSGEILSALDSIEIESDIGLIIMQRVDDHYISLYAQEIRRKRASKT